MEEGNSSSGGDNDERVKEKGKSNICFNTKTETKNRGWKFFLFELFSTLTSLQFAHFEGGKRRRLF